MAIWTVEIQVAHGPKNGRWRLTAYHYEDCEPSDCADRVLSVSGVCGENAVVPMPRGRIT